jgi:hypothetical protein
VAGAFNPQQKPTPCEFEKMKKKIANTLKFVKHVKPLADQLGVIGQFAFWLWTKPKLNGTVVHCIHPHSGGGCAGCCVARSRPCWSGDKTHGHVHRRKRLDGTDPAPNVDGEPITDVFCHL